MSETTSTTAAWVTVRVAITTSLPAGLPPISDRYHRGDFRPAEVRETGEAWNAVVVRGPKRTSTGKDHASQRGEVGYSYASVPEWLVPYVQGPEAMHQAAIAAIEEKLAELRKRGPIR